MGSFDARRRDIIGSVLESCHIHSLASVVGREKRLSLVLLFHLLHLGFALEFSFESGLSVGVDRLLRKVVCSATG
jgi:hypothetical protein